MGSFGNAESEFAKSLRTDSTAAQSSWDRIGPLLVSNPSQLKRSVEQFAGAGHVNGDQRVEERVDGGGEAEPALCGNRSRDVVAQNAHGSGDSRLRVGRAPGNKLSIGEFSTVKPQGRGPCHDRLRTETRLESGGDSGVGVTWSGGDDEAAQE